MSDPISAARPAHGHVTDRPCSLLVEHVRLRDTRGWIGTTPGCLACAERHGPDYAANLPALLDITEDPVSAPTGAPDGTRATAEAQEAAEGNSGPRVPHEIRAIAKRAGDTYDHDTPEFTWDGYREAVLAAVTPAIEQRVRLQTLDEVDAYDAAEARAEAAEGRTGERADLVEVLVQTVGCPLPCMGHDETRRAYAEIVAAVAPAIRAQVAAEIERDFYDAGGYLDAATERAARRILRRLRGDA